jgi:hypothetical protein
MGMTCAFIRINICEGGGEGGEVVVEAKCGGGVGTCSIATLAYFSPSHSVVQAGRHGNMTRLNM